MAFMSRQNGDGYDGYPQNEDQLNDCLATGDEEAYRSLKMTIKVPPAFNGHVQTQGYFAYEDSVEEWVSITSVEKQTWSFFEKLTS